jgi:uncharacterized membrane protein
MNFFQDRIQLKASAKDKLMGKYSAAISVMILVMLLQLTVSLLTSIIPINSTFGYAVNLIVTYGLSVLIGVLTVGLNLFFLSIACDQPFFINQLFYGYQEQPNKALCISAVFSLVQLICVLPGELYFQRYLVTRDNQYLYSTILSFSIGLLIYTLISLMLSQSFYIMLDFPDMNARETLAYSMKRMKGHKIRLFVLDLSFLPLILLCLLSMGIGLLWLSPYMTMANTLFYLDLMHPSESTSNTH